MYGKLRISTVWAYELHVLLATEADSHLKFRVWMWNAPSLQTELIPENASSLLVAPGANFILVSSVEEAMRVLETLVFEVEAAGYRRTAFPLFSTKTKKDDTTASNPSSVVVDDAVQFLVERIFAAATHVLSTLTKSSSSLTFAQVQSAEALLLAIEAELETDVKRDTPALRQLATEYFRILPRRSTPPLLDNFAALETERDLIQTLKDLISV
jgi:hypothetical protein